MDDSSEEILTGRIGVEADQGYTQMPFAKEAQPAEFDPAEIDTESPTYKHLTRPEDPIFDIEREYFDTATGKPRPANEAVPLEKVSDDLAAARRQERAEREAAIDVEMRTALDGLETPQAQQDQQTPESFEPQPETAEADAARTEVDAAWSAADQAIEEALKQPLVREKLEHEFNTVRQEAAAVAEQARQEAEQIKSAYIQHANALTGQLNALVLSNFPELQGVAHDHQQLAGAVQLLAKTNPQRAQQLQDFALRASTVAGQLQQQQYQQTQIAQQQAAEAFQRYAAEQDAKGLAKETPESLAQIRNVIYADAEKAGIPRAQLEQAWNSNPTLRHAFVSELVADGAKWRMSQRALATHRVNPVVPSVQRPGVASPGPTADPGEIAAASARFNLPGGNLGRDGLRNAAALITARRARG
jgi:hypothetical protein